MCVLHEAGSACVFGIILGVKWCWYGDGGHLASGDKSGGFFFFKKKKLTQYLDYRRRIAGLFRNEQWSAQFRVSSGNQQYQIRRLMWVFKPEEPDTIESYCHIAIGSMGHTFLEPDFLCRGCLALVASITNFSDALCYIICILSECQVCRRS